MKNYKLISVKYGEKVVSFEDAYLEFDREELSLKVEIIQNAGNLQSLLEIGISWKLIQDYFTFEMPCANLVEAFAG